MPVPPKPPEQRRRRNTTGVKPDVTVPRSGRKGLAPESPFPLGADGYLFWTWAWSTPQATTWHNGFLIPLAVLALDFEAWCESPPHDRDSATLQKGWSEFGLTPRAMSMLHLFVTDDEEGDDDEAGVVSEAAVELRRRVRQLGAASNE